MYFVGILPKKKGPFSLAEMNLEALITSASDEYSVKIGLPKFKVEENHTLIKPLKEMGLSLLFDPSRANFSAMSPSKKLYVDSLVQKTSVDIDEIGTEASAVTAFGMKTTAIPNPKESKQIILNRPFAFAIYDSESKEFLFTGKIVNLP